MSRTPRRHLVICALLAGSSLPFASVQVARAGSEQLPFGPGVCCFGPGSAVCLPVSDVVGDCINNGLSYVVGGTCSPNSCPGNNAGACCFGFNNCQTHYDPVACANNGGTFQGAGTNCDNDPCDIAACCFATAPCQMMLKPACEAAGGGFIRFVACDPEFNPCNTGACCASFTACTMRSAYDCIVVNDLTFVPFGDCDNPFGNCNVADGACCYFDGCEIGSSNCGKGAGIFYGVGSTCEEVNCAERACCNVNGSCTMMEEEACTLSGGVFNGSSTCPLEPCGVNACCVGTTCLQATYAECINLGGFHFGFFTQPCTPELCGVPACPCNGDANNDALRDGRDIQSFVDCAILAGNGGPVPPGCDCADVTGDGLLDGSDVFSMVLVLLSGPC